MVHLEHGGCYGSNLVLVGATLEGREHGEVDLGLKVVHDVLACLLVLPLNALPIEDDTSPGNECLQM